MRIKLIVGALVMGCAIAVSAVAAYFSVVGLAALFAAAFIPVCLMSIFLEMSKLVAAGWLHSNWKNPHVSRLHKGYLISAVLVLMSITSMGCYGFLLKSHLEQNTPTASIQVDLDQKQARLDQLTAERDGYVTQEKTIDQTVTGYLGSGKAQGASRFMNQQKGERENIEAKINDLNDQITQANVDMAPLKKQVAASGVELGQWKYLAKALGLKDPDAAIDILVKMLMFAFDPLAVVLMISGTITLGEWAREKREHVPERTALETLAPEVDEDDLGDIRPRNHIPPHYLEGPEPEPNNLDHHFDFVADLGKSKEIGLIAQEVPEWYASTTPEPQAEHDPEETFFKPLDEYPETPRIKPDADLDEFDRLIGLQKIEVPTGQIFKIRPPVLPSPAQVVEPPQATHPQAIKLGITDDEFYEMLEGDQDKAAEPVPPPVVEIEAPARNLIAEYFGISDRELESIMTQVMPTSEAKAELRDWAKAMLAAEPVDPRTLPIETQPEPVVVNYASGPRVEGRGTKVERLSTEEEMAEFRESDFGRDLETFVTKVHERLQPANYLDWPNAVVEAHTVDPQVETIEDREPEPDLVPEPVVPALSGTIRVYVDPHADDTTPIIMPYKGHTKFVEVSPISLEEAYAREMAEDQDEELQTLEADINRVGDRNILLALLEENPTLLEEIMQAYDEAKAETEEPPPVPQNATKKPMNWFDAVNLSGSSRKN